MIDWSTVIGMWIGMAIGGLILGALMLIGFHVARRFRVHHNRRLWRQVFGPTLAEAKVLAEQKRKATLIQNCAMAYQHHTGTDTMVIHPTKRDRLSCMYCPFDLPLPTRYREIRGGSIGGGWSTVEVIEP
jgi:hypothetical protein